MKKRVHTFHSNGFYMLSGHATANSLFFEDRKDQELFFTLLNRFLGSLIDLHYYYTSPTEWSLFFTIHDEQIIRDVYTQFKRKSKNYRKIDGRLSCSNMISEHFRYFLSSYVKQSNFRHGRHGSRVHSRMEKYVMETKADLDTEIRRMREMREVKVQKPKYRANMGYYLVDLEMSRKSVWRNSFVGLAGEKLIQAVLPFFQWILHQVQVVRELIQTTWHAHFGPNTNPFQPPQLE